MMAKAEMNVEVKVRLAAFWKVIAAMTDETCEQLVAQAEEGGMDVETMLKRTLVFDAELQRQQDEFNRTAGELRRQNRGLRTRNETQAGMIRTYESEKNRLQGEVADLQRRLDVLWELEQQEPTPDEPAFCTLGEWQQVQAERDRALSGFAFQKEYARQLTLSYRQLREKLRLRTDALNVGIRQQGELHAQLLDTQGELADAKAALTKEIEEAWLRGNESGLKQGCKEGWVALARRTATQLRESADRFWEYTEDDTPRLSEVIAEAVREYRSNGLM